MVNLIEAATNSATPPKLLAELASSKDFEIRKAVASNPNTPTDVLLKISTEFPKEVIENPVFDLLLLENPSLGEKIGYETINSLLKLTADRNLSKSVLLTLIALKNKELQQAAKLHVNFAGEMKEGWEEVLKDAIETSNFTTKSQRDREVEELFAYLLELIPEFLIPKLLEWGFSFKVGLAKNHNTPVHLLEKIALDNEKNYKYGQRYLAANPSIPIYILEKLANYQDQIIRAELASNPIIPVYLLEKLAEDRNRRVRAAVVNNFNTPVYLLEKLAEDRNRRVRGAVARNFNTPVYLLEKLAGEQNERIRACIAYNPNTPVYILDRLAREQNERICAAMSHNPNTPAYILEQLAIEYSYRENIRRENIRAVVAKNPNTPIANLEKLADCTSYRVRCQVAKNPNTPVYLLEKLAADPDCYLLIEILQHPKTSFQIKQKVFNRCTELSLDSPSLTHLAVFFSPHADPETLARHSNSISWIERCAIAQNPNTPQNILEYLATDGNRVVRAAAIANSLHRSNK